MNVLNSKFLASVRRFYSRKSKEELLEIIMDDYRDRLEEEE